MSVASKMRKHKKGVPHYQKRAISHHLSKNKIEILASVTVFAIILVLLLFFGYSNDGSTTPPESSDNIVDAGDVQTSQCMIDNPRLTEEKCRDLELHDTAIAEDRKELCDDITDEGLRDHCRRYFID
jgi:hypothetical protein